MNDRVYIAREDSRSSAEVAANDLQPVFERLIQNPVRVLVIEGPAGSGKSAFAKFFVRQFHDQFPGGIEVKYGSGQLDHQISPAGPGRRLIVFDGLDEAFPGREWAIDFLRASSDEPETYILATSRPGVPHPFERMLLTASYRPVDLLMTASGLNDRPPESLVIMAKDNPALAVAIGELARKAHGWDAIFQWLSPFDLPGLVDPHGRPLSSRSKPAQALITCVRQVDEQVMRMINSNPDLVYQLSPREFELMCAEMYERLGFKVELTPASRDGGKDLIIVGRSDLGKILTYVECKRYAPDDKVGVRVVRELNGVVEAGRATTGIVLTTSSFTKAARDFERKVEFRLSLKDYQAFKTMLSKAMGPQTPSKY